MQKNGIDVSKHQGYIDWQKVKNSGKVDYAIIRAGFGSSVSQKDEKFEANYANAKKNGIPVGTYWYSYAKDTRAAKTEAEVFLKIIEGKTFECPIYLDIEEASQFRLGKSKVTEIVKVFCETLEKAGYFVGIYSFKSGLSYIDTSVRDKYTVWVAQVNVQKTNYSGPHDQWQYSWKGSIPGIRGNVDLDYSYKDFESIIKGAGKNGFKRESGLSDNASANTVPSNSSPTTPVQPTTKKFQVKVICNALNVRSGPGLSYKATQVVKQNEIYTIVEEKNGWGKLISGAGWINIGSSYVKRV